jgi:hypothetical protein
MEYVYVIIAVVLVIGVLASIYGLFIGPTGAAVSDIFKVGLFINDSITTYNYQAFAKNNMTAIDVLSEKMEFTQKELTGGVTVESIMTSSWIENNNESEWVFMVNGKIPYKDGVIIYPNRYYVISGDNISFVYVPKST